jgi:hypothetical protein
VLDDYDRRHCCVTEVDWLAAQPSLRAAIEVAAAATDRDGRRHPHQRRLSRATIRHATAALLAAEARIRSAESFDALHERITAQLRDVAGAGELYAYDSAVRIGMYLRLAPTRVYLHAGTRQGARALGLDYRKPALEVSELPLPLRRRQPAEVEDILCIYKDWFSGAAARA